MGKSMEEKVSLIVKLINEKTKTYQNEYSNEGRACHQLCKDILFVIEEIINEGKKIKVISYDEEKILFSDGSTITFNHEQDCCENNYADFEQLEGTGIEEEEFEKPLIIESVNSGFIFGNKGKMYFVPCYSEQNGYYTTNISIFYNDIKMFELDAKLLDD